MKVATLIPVHLQKFNYALDTLESFYKFNKENNLYFIFSNIQEYEIFLTSTNLNFNSIIIPDTIDLTKNPINIKKFYGLNYLFDKNFDLIGVLDADIRFVNYFDSQIIYHEIANLGYFKSNLSKYGGGIIKHIATKAQLDNNTKLINQTDNFTHYWWFNDICVYNKDLYLEFYNWLISLNNYHDIKNDFWCFDYLLYSIWLIVYKDYKIKLMDAENLYDWGALEHNFYSKNLSLTFKSYADAYSLSDTPEHIKIQLHIDRTPKN
jgi:hypothetical protein